MAPRPLTELTRYRNRHKPPISMTAVAIELGVKPVTVWRWENGKRSPERDHLLRIADLIDVPAAQLAGLSQ